MTESEEEVSEIVDPPPETTDEKRRRRALAFMAQCEARAIELDGESAPQGVDAIQARYYPPDVLQPNAGEIGAENLRRVIRGILEP